MMAGKPIVAVHKFSSCDGCQLAFLNLGEKLLALSRLIDIRHFVEAGAWAPDEEVDIAFVEGSISTAEEQERIEHIRRQSRYLITIGACATAGGLQALRNLNHSEQQWRNAIYARPEFIKTLDHSEPVAARVRVDLELWGCPVSSRQVVTAVRDLLFGVAPTFPEEKVCMECKRRQAVCTLVTQQKPCMG
ncbi:MAG TPA: sulfhydrogenase subunit delta, partial [Gammaproteobacteria bacterium]|nr:sulfhydrogenase subunit delta [Gammaproteobacteria bacterium]